MKKIIFILIVLSFFRMVSVQACTKEEFNALDHEIADAQKKHREEKLTQLDNYLQQIKAKKKLSDKEFFVYRTGVLNNPKAKKLYLKERKLNISDYFQVSAEADCKTLKKWTDESMESANKQWDIVFEDLEKELKQLE